MAAFEAIPSKDKGKGEICGFHQADFSELVRIWPSQNFYVLRLFLGLLPFLVLSHIG